MRGIQTKILREMLEVLQEDIYEYKYGWNGTETRSLRPYALKNDDKIAEYLEKTELYDYQHIAYEQLKNERKSYDIANTLYYAKLILLYRKSFDDFKGIRQNTLKTFLRMLQYLVNKISERFMKLGIDFSVRNIAFSIITNRLKDIDQDLKNCEAYKKLNFRNKYNYLNAIKLYSRILYESFYRL